MIETSGPKTAYKYLPKRYSIPIDQPSKLEKGDHIAFTAPVHKSGKGGPKIVGWHTYEGIVLNPNWEFGTKVQIDEKDAGIIHRKHKELKENKAFMKPRIKTFRGWLDSDKKDDMDRVSEAMGMMGKAMNKAFPSMKELNYRQRMTRYKRPGPFTRWLTQNPRR